MKGKAGTPPKLVTIATFSHLEEPHLDRARLSAEGTWSVVADHYIGTMKWLYSSDNGWGQLRVKSVTRQTASWDLFCTVLVKEHDGE